jgi:type IV pilus biogenesis protein CpaD/CtpE
MGATPVRDGDGAGVTASGPRLRLPAPDDRVAAEALALEIRRLARQHGIEVTSVRVEAGGLDADPAGPAGR